ncbi:MAG: gamma-glutamyltransferase, partial [Burkholderiaceae bacterium]
MSFNWTNPYPTIRSPVMARNVVSTSHPLASSAGLRMLLKGGNAVDAAIAAAATLTVVEPISNGLGSDLFAILWDGKALQGLNASGVAPAAWSPDYFKRKHNGAIPMRGWDSVTVPGAVAGWMALSKRCGKLPFADLFEPAIEIAERGHGVGRIVSHKWGLQVPLLQAQPGYAQAFMPGGRAPAPGERFKFAAAGATLRKIAATRGEAFYRGEIAQALAAHSSANGGSMSAQDLAAYQPDWVGTIAQDYAGHSVHEIPPNGQGIAALMALGLLQHFDIASLPVDGIESQHLQIEAMKLAFADTYRWVADASAMRDVTREHLLDASYLAQRAKLIDRNRASDFKHGTPPRGGTIYMSTADSSGMMVSLIQSNYMGFGSGVVVPEVGVSLQ